MVFKVYSGRVRGVFGDLITVEVDASPGLPEISIIGLPGSVVKEAKDRVKVALKNCGVTIPSVKLVINLSPADEHKESTGLDLPIAVGFLGVFGHLPEFDPTTTLLLGEISLDGKLIPVRGVLPIVKMAMEQGFKKVILPKENAEEGALIQGIKIIPAESVMDVMTYLSLNETMAEAFLPAFNVTGSGDEDAPDYECDFKDVYGQEAVKRAAAIAASGFHHLLLTGPPGTGKSLIAKRIPGIMPSLTYEESLEVTTIYSVSGKLKEKSSFIKIRPFISPHHSASSVAFTGGGPNASPGLVSLCHKGILFLDEMAEFKKETLDMLRQPLEDHTITVSRTKSSLTYPAEFMLVGAMNPCPCGYFPDRNRCSCSDSSIERYL
ncbi:MAG: YifB family Mg chelatase-like AAA ATPase, partial [Lachnospiraceae bacterium]|nr:YifB family Mg chelatase-like AAA ATPase [Lachnospiraceae bacterium]